MKSWNHLVLALGVIVAVSACSRVEPHIKRLGEFDRKSPTFNKKPKDLEKVVVCFNHDVATRAEVEAMAREECAQVDKAARLVSGSYLDCPVLVPYGAVFACVAGETRPAFGRTLVPSGGTGGSSGPAFPGTSYTGPTDRR